MVADPHPTTWAALAVKAGRKDGTYLLPVCTQFETSGSRVASNRSLQWGEQIVKPIFESKDDYEVMYLIAKKLGFADKMFKNIKVENRSAGRRGHAARDEPRQLVDRLLRPVAGAAEARTWRTRRTSTWSRCARRRRPNAGDYYGLPWPCWGTPEVKHPGTPLLYNTNLDVMDGGGTFRARFGVEREEKLPDGTTRKVSLLAEGSYSKDSEIKDGYPRIHLRRAQEARLGQGPHRRRTRRDQEDRRRDNADDGVVVDSISPAASSALRSSTAASPTATARRARMRSDLPDPIPVHREPIYYAAARPGRQISDAARRQAVPPAEYRLHGAEGGGGQGHRQGVPADPHLRPSGRIRRRRRGDPLQQVARRAAAGHVHRDQSGGCRRARHQGRRLGLGDRRREQRRRPG